MSNPIEIDRHTSDLIREAIGPKGAGKATIDRIMKAYGFPTKLALCNHLGVSQSTLANRYLRDTYPADWVLICNVETNASIIWLSTGIGEPFSRTVITQTVSLTLQELENGVLTSQNEILISRNILPASLKSGFAIRSEQVLYVVEREFHEITDGLWVIEIDGLVSIRELYRLPGSRVKVENGKASFECKVEEISVLGKAISKTEYF